MYGADITFNYKRPYTINAYSIGNAARFLSHCCKPNLAATKIIRFDGKPAIVLHAIRDI